MNFYLAAFLIIPVVALIAREAGKLRLSRWIIFFGYLAVGWLLVYLAVQSYLDNLDEPVRNTPHPSKELLDEWQDDGAKEVFALYFGWAFATVYFLACLMIINLVRALRRK
jgi:hypothetical protein